MLKKTVQILGSYDPWTAEELREQPVVERVQASDILHWEGFNRLLCCSTGSEPE
jgi:hypothetical protein